MTQKVVVIFGGTGGIGSETARQMLKKGLKVFAIGHEWEDVNNLKKEITNPNFFTLQADVTNENSVADAFKTIKETAAQIDVVVFSVSGAIENKQILSPKTAWSDYNWHLELQLKGLFNIVRGMEGQIKTGSKLKFIILLTEACTGRPVSGLSHYISAKYSLMGFAKTMSVELAKFNCTVNMVSPGMVDTNLIAGFPQKLIEVTAEGNPMGRIATVRDVAQVVLFLSGEESDYINGVNIFVNGGGVMA